MLTWHLNTTHSTELQKVLIETREQITVSGRAPHRPLNANTIVIDYDTTNEKELLERAELVARHQPGRIFYFSDHPTVKLPLDIEIREKYAVGGALIQKQQSHPVLTEFIFASLQSILPEALLSTVIANLNVGFKPTLIVLGAPTNSKLLSLLLPYASEVIFSSEKLKGLPKVLDQLFESNIELVDLNWIRLSGWRAQLRNLSLRYNLEELQESLEKVILFADEPDAETYLMAGWMLRQLESTVSTLGKDGFECSSEIRSYEKGPPGKLQHRWNLELRADLSRIKQKNSEKRGLSALHLIFRPNQNHPEGAKIEVVQGENWRFNTTLRTGSEELHFSGAGRKGDDLESLKRFLTRGESTTTYRDASVEGRLLEHLSEGEYFHGC